jgi:transposase
MTLRTQFDCSQTVLRVSNYSVSNAPRNCFLQALPKDIHIVCYIHLGQSSYWTAPFKCYNQLSIHRVKWRLKMALKRRQFTREFKLQVLREIEAGKSLAQAAREHQVHPTLLGRWQKQHAQYAQHAFSGNGQAYTQEARIAALERKIGQLTMENDLLKKALLRFEAQERSRNGGGNT